ncbi:pulmonary surfactant-associated protein C-like isoform X1 [Hemicordylus capensis]|uniref:pulmonary surfactant-associated protein C-like isoform X1 n=1 Tax=Hemicordylus capensis TaxID=884348 RepID=UPI0023037073|nr:pulmonary surfactant-associated protein C-like isoform X1 [Hemicordylus capensis]
MQTSSKEALLAEAPPDYSASPRLPGLPCKKMLIVVVVVVVIVLVVLGFLLMGLHISEKHTETVLQMTIQGLDGKTSPQHLSMSRKEQVATFQVNGNLNSSATVVYDYSNLLIGYRSWPGQSCHVTRMNKEDIQGLEAVAKVFQQAQTKLLKPSLKQSEEEGGHPAPLADRSALGTTLNILCSHLPVYWA